MGTQCAGKRFERWHNRKEFILAELSKLNEQGILPAGVDFANILASKTKLSQSLFISQIRVLIKAGDIRQFEWYERPSPQKFKPCLKKISHKPGDYRKKYARLAKEIEDCKRAQDGDCESACNKIEVKNCQQLYDSLVDRIMEKR